MYRYFRDLVDLASRDEDMPGPNMVLDPRRLPDLSSKEIKRLSHKIFHDGDPDSDSAVYEYLFEVYFPDFL